MIIVVRQPHPDPDRYPTAPAVPWSWDIVEEIDGWVTVYPLGRESRPDVFVHARKMAEVSGWGIFAVGGPNAILRQLHQSAQWAWTIKQLRADNGAAAATVKAALRDERPRDENGDPIGERYGIYRTIAGFDYASAAEGADDLP